MLKIIKKNLDIISWVVMTVMINYFPPDDPYITGPYRAINVNSPLYGFARYAVPLFYLVLIIYRRWRSRW